MIKFYDTHGHLNCDPLNQEVETIIATMRKEKVFQNCAGYDLVSSIRAVELATKYPDCVAATIAIHPNEVQLHDLDSIKEQFQALIEKNHQQIVAIGECGLDKHYSTEYFDLQSKWLIMQVKLAQQYCLPLVFHIRDAHQEMITFLNQNPWIKVPIVIHCFSQDLKTFQQYESTYTDIYYSIPGIVTFANAYSLQEAVRKIPLNKILIETDCPWLTPVPYRGKTNYPFYLKFTAQKIAALRQEPLIKISEQILHNSLKIFRH